METKRRQYSGQFKKEAVEHSLSSGKTAEEVAQDLGISSHNLKRWHAQYHRFPRLYRRGTVKTQAVLVLFLLLPGIGRICESLPR